MVKIDISHEQLLKIIKKLPVKERTRIVEELQKDTWQHELKQMLKRIDARLKKHPISQREVKKIVEEAREEYHAKSRR